MTSAVLSQDSKHKGEKGGEGNYVSFEAMARYLGTSLIVTIPVKAREILGLKKGDRVIVQVRKKEDGG